ncbi:MAG: M28 family metallopeptidase [Solirubrobacterales bacterium]
MWVRAASCSLLAMLVLAGCGGDEDGSSGNGGRFDAERAFADLEAQVAIGQRPAGSPASRETARLIAGRLREAGAEDVRIQRPWRNVVATLPGRERGEAVVVGAHHDTKDDVGAGFEGANDGASGVAVVLELARSLPRPLPGPSVHLALFDAEEARGDRPFELDGARGSRQYVAYARRGEQGSAPLSTIEAMVLFDLVGDCDLQVPREANSDSDLYRAFAEAARDVDGSAAPFEGTRTPILDDHIPFVEAGIPAVDVIDFTFGPGGSPGAYFHTPEDTLDKVCPESLDAVGEAAVRVLTGVY